MDKFKIRASASGNIIGAKPPKLLKGHKTYAQTWLKEQIYGVKQSFSSKYTEKGLMVEDDAIEYLIQNLDLPVLTAKNEEYFEDEYFTGTPDIITDDCIIDVKSSWNCFTFPLFEDELPNKDYFWQMQTYMALTGIKKAEICYVLMNTPEEIAPWEEHHDYSKISPENRIKVFKVEYDPEAIKMLKEQVKLVREYIKSIYNPKN